MPSPVGHTFGAYIAIIGLNPRWVTSRQSHSIALGLSFLFGSLPDADFIVAHFTKIPYLQHHYFTHSIPFNLFVMLLIYLCAKAFRARAPGKTAMVLGAAYGTHLLMDYMTEDGSYPYGIPLLWPFSDRHFVSPYQIFYSIHRGEWKDIFSMHNLAAISIEIAVALPVAVIIVFLSVRRASRPTVSS